MPMYGNLITTIYNDGLCMYKNVNCFHYTQYVN